MRPGTRRTWNVFPSSCGPADQISENYFCSLKNEDDILSFLAQNLTFFSPHIWTSDVLFQRFRNERKPCHFCCWKVLVEKFQLLFDDLLFLCAHISYHPLISLRRNLLHPRKSEDVQMVFFWWHITFIYDDMQWKTCFTFQKQWNQTFVMKKLCIFSQFIFRVTKHRWGNMSWVQISLSHFGTNAPAGSCLYVTTRWPASGCARG